jgi:hypothetical protein
MRKLLVSLAVLGLIALGLPAVSSAEETAKISSFKAKAVKIPKATGGFWPKTGNCFGCGAAIEAEYEIEGSGYAASPLNPKGGIPPISGVNFFLPAGVKLHPGGFGTCTEEKLANEGAKGCLTNSIASPVGSVLGEVSLVNAEKKLERVPETATLQAFFGPGGSLLFFSKGETPVLLEVISSGKYKPSHKPPYGEELETLVPAVPTVSTSLLASVSKIKITAGAAIKKGKKVIYYGTVPKKCPKGGFPIKTEVKFGGSFGGKREFGIPEKVQEATFKAPCPKRPRRHR